MIKTNIFFLIVLMFVQEESVRQSLQKIVQRQQKSHKKLSEWGVKYTVYHLEGEIIKKTAPLLSSELSRATARSMQQGGGGQDSLAK